MRRKGFTLIELLVVIAIIALLLAILMPALGAAKRIAKSVVCRTNLKQWGIVTALYGQDNDNKLFQRDAGGSLDERQASWIGATIDYVNDSDIRICPSTKKPLERGDDMGNFGSTTKQWGSLWTTSTGIRMQGSYGMNGWAASPPSRTNEWKSTTARGSANIPLFLDCAYYTGRPRNADTLQGQEDSRDESGDNAIQLFTANRHNEAVNVVLLDGSALDVTLKGLWRLKWHKNYKTQGYTGAWPDWMRGFKD